MRRISLRAGTALALILPLVMAPAFSTNAAAQEKKDQHGGGAPAARAAPPAPVQHAAPPAPAPHIAAPVAATPHFATPAARIAAPVQQQHIQQQEHLQQQHIAAPAHIAAPTHAAAPVHVATPHVAAQQINKPNLAHSNAAHDNAANTVVKQKQIQAHGNNAGPHNLDKNAGSHELAHRGTPTTPNASNAARTVTGPNKTLPNSAASKVATPSNKPLPNGAAPSVLGQGKGDRDHNTVNQQAQIKAQQQAQAQARAQIYSGHGKPVLHNPMFANGSARDPALRALAHATFQGRFAQFHQRDRHDRFAFGRGFHGIVIGWGGPVFWPYAYADLVDYTFWPSANDTFWPYAYDDVYDGIFGAYAPDATAYANVPSAGRRPLPRGAIATGLSTGVATGVAAGGMAQICAGQATGLTDWPIERIAQQVQPTSQQRSLLEQLKDATAQAVNLLQSACPTDLPSTPTGRLAAMRQRIEPMLQAVQVVRPALDKFYGSLSDEQKERFIALEAEGAPKAAAKRQPDVAQACGGSAKQIASLPIAQMQQLLRPNDVQRAALDGLNNASAQAAAVLNESCAPDQSLTPPGRVAAMEARLTAMLKALDTVQPAIARFYNSLTDEQKARFDRLGPRQG
jgi:hypothetical protein